MTRLSRGRNNGNPATDGTFPKKWRVRRPQLISSVRRTFVIISSQLIINSLTVQCHFKAAVSYPFKPLTLSVSAFKPISSGSQLNAIQAKDNPGSPFLKSGDVISLRLPFGFSGLNYKVHRPEDGARERQIADRITAEQQARGTKAK